MYMTKSELTHRFNPGDIVLVQLWSSFRAIIIEQTSKQDLFDPDRWHPTYTVKITSRNQIHYDIYEKNLFANLEEYRAENE